jgi:hypothetical protein
MLSLFDELGAITDCRFCDCECDEDIVGRATAFKMDVAASRSFCWVSRREFSGMSSTPPLLPLPPELTAPLPPLPLPPTLTAPPTPPSEAEVEAEVELETTAAAAAAAAGRRPRLTLPSPNTTLHSGILACGPMVTPAQTLVCAPITL